MGNLTPEELFELEAKILKLKASVQVLEDIIRSMRLGMIDYDSEKKIINDRYNELKKEFTEIREHLDEKQ